ncbi:MAG: glycosyltransferase family 2 protein [Chloroflexaceae bacterium]|nr:glycosyltransferase family 2 protein [Chloroflexaceae bacterium]
MNAGKHHVPTVSVVIAACNASAWIAETLESVFAQTFHDFEVIVVDDGSTDDTATVVSQFPQVQCISTPNKGPSAARNMGIRLARGEYIAFIDADDLWHPDKLRLQVDLLRRTGLAWVYCDTYLFDHRTKKRLYTYNDFGRLHEGDVLRSLFLDNFILSPTPVIKRSVFEKINFFDETILLRMGPAEDWNMWLHIASHYPVGLVNYPLAQCRLHQNSISRHATFAASIASSLWILENAVARNPEQLSHLKHRAVARVFLRVSIRLAARGNFTTAWNMFVRSLRLSPGEVLVFLSWFVRLVWRAKWSVVILLWCRLRYWHQGK